MARPPPTIRVLVLRASAMWRRTPPTIALGALRASALHHRTPPTIALSACTMGHRAPPTIVLSVGGKVRSHRQRRPISSNARAWTRARMTWAMAARKTHRLLAATTTTAALIHTQLHTSNKRLPRRSLALGCNRRSTTSANRSPRNNARMCVVMRWRRRGLSGGVRILGGSRCSPRRSSFARARRPRLRGPR